MVSTALGLVVLALSASQDAFRADPRALAEPEPLSVRLVAPQAEGGAWIGVGLTPPEGDQHGLGVIETHPDSPAARIGLRPGDRLLTLNGRRLRDIEGLKALLAERSPGERVDLGLLRSVELVLDERGYGKPGEARMGVHLAPGEGNTWSVNSVSDGWPSAAAGLREGDRVQSIQGERVESFDRLMEILVDIEPGDTLALVLTRHVEFELGSRPDAGDPVVPPQLRWRRVEPDAPRGLPREPEEPRGLPAPRFRLVPPGGGAPEAERRYEEVPDAPLRGDLRDLHEELRGLHEELRSLHEELRRLRTELAEARGRGR